MEVVNVGTVSVDDAIEIMLDPDNLKALIGWHGALCFALVREITAPGFYGHLIKNAATIDSTTRDHIAFVVFYGDRSGITHRAGTDYRPYMARYQVDGFSVSTDRDIHVESRPHLPNFRPEFDPQLGERFRYSPSQVDRPTLSQKMSYASRYLMERYSVPEEALPCLLFVDASDPTKRITVRLSSKDPLRSLYDDTLRSLSQEFSELSHFWKRRDEIKRNRYRLKDAETQVCELPGKIAECNEKLNRATEAATNDVPRISGELDQWKDIQATLKNSFEDLAVRLKIEHHPVAWQVIEKLPSYHNRLAIAKNIEDKLLMLAPQNEKQSTAHLSLERAKLEKRLRRVRQSIDSRYENITLFITDNIRRLQHTITQAKTELDSATWDKKNLERRLQEATAFLREHNLNTLDEDERLLADLDRSLRTRGYGDDVLTDSRPAAFSVIKSLWDRRKIGIQEQVYYEGRTMKILFLAANPLQTSRLDLEEELRSLEQELRGVKLRDSISLIARHAVRPDDLIRYVRSDKPNVIHFSGHGSKAGIMLRDDTSGYQVVEGGSLKRFLENRGVDLIVLNACYSDIQAKIIIGAVKTVVGTTDVVSDEAARRFSVAFYRSLGDGLSIREAFRDGGDAVALHGLNDVFHSSGELDLALVTEIAN